MLSTAVALATLTTAGLLIIYGKLPRRIRKFIEKHNLLTDILCLIGVYFILGGTLTALFAASICGLIVSILLHVANNPDDYLYLYDLRTFVKDKLADAKDAMNAYGETYRKRKETEVDVPKVVV